MNIKEFYEQYPDSNSAQGCSEPGYDDKPVILANWNNIPAEVYDGLESQGYDCEWEDEWLICDSCFKAFRCSPDSYGWEMFGIIKDGEAICGNCLNMSDYLESIQNNPKQALTCTLQDKRGPIEQYGYELVKTDLESGFYDGQTDNPKQILKSMLLKYPTDKFVFVIDSQGQFDISFSLYKKIRDDQE